MYCSQGFRSTEWHLQAFCIPSAPPMWALYLQQECLSLITTHLDFLLPASPTQMLPLLNLSSLLNFCPSEHIVYLSYSPTQIINLCPGRFFLHLFIPLVSDIIEPSLILPSITNRQRHWVFEEVKCLAQPRSDHGKKQNWDLNQVLFPLCLAHCFVGT